MATDFNILAGGEAGQGVQSVGTILARTMSNGGLHVFADQDYESRVRGGHNFFRIRISDREILSLSEKLDILIALNKETIDLHSDELKSNGVIIYDQEQTKFSAQGEVYFNVPLGKLAEEKVKNKLMTNTVAVGAAIGLCGYDFNILSAVLKKEFIRHGDKIVEDNIIAARAGFDFAVEYGANKLVQKIQPVSSDSKRMLLHGNEALALGSMVGGCKFFSGYPMTPATSIMEYLADKGRQHNVVTVHVEDEIAAMNMAVGAAYSGVRAMVATSGGGFALMVEGLALAGITETPIVVVLAQRPGPATGLPTRTEQGELWFALHAGHGEFPRAILAPATVEEAFHSIIKAFNIAEKYQTPVFVLTDHHLASSYATVERFDLSQVKIDRGELLSDEEVSNLTDYKRYLVTESGISPRALPGQGKALVVTDSDEHDEAGHMIEDAETRNQQNLKRLRKQDALSKEIGAPRFHKAPNAKYTLVGWGSTYGAIKEAGDTLNSEGVAVNVLHLSEIWPFPAEAVASILDNGAKSIAIEGNATAQMAQLIRRETGQAVSGSILKFDGRPFSAEEIVTRFKKEGF
ncbi:2-oxoacid:acceptor oxidoreductase subunit alpha [Chloroflexota bacterium]